MDGQALRHSLSMIPSENKRAAIFVDPSKININFQNDKKCAVYNMNINVANLKHFEYDFRDPIANNLLPYWSVHFDSSDLHKATGKVGSKDKIILMAISKEGHQWLRVMVLKAKDNYETTGYSNIRISVNDPPTFYGAPEVPLDPKAKITSQRFTAVCSLIVSMKSQVAEFIFHNNTMTLRGLDATKTIVHSIDFPYNSSLTDTDKVIEKMSDMNINDDEKPLMLTVLATTIKNFSKINNISLKTSIIKFYLHIVNNDNVVLIMKFPISNFGECTIVLKNSNIAVGQ